MRRLLCLLPYLLLFVALSGCSAATQNETETKSAHGLSSLVIIIDPGHGGIDHGAISSSGIREDKLNLQISQLVEDMLRQAGASVILTRETDDVDYSGEGNTRKRRDMNNRAELIQKHNPQAIISIHMNKYPKTKYHGSLTFYWKENDNGKKLASCIQEALINGLPGNNQYPARAGNYFILHADDAPSALVECGFLSNPEDEKKLQDPEYQWKIAECIFQGICSYFGVQ